MRTVIKYLPVPVSGFLISRISRKITIHLSQKGQIIQPENSISIPMVHPSKQILEKYRYGTYQVPTGTLKKGMKVKLLVRYRFCTYILTTWAC